MPSYWYIPFFVAVIALVLDTVCLFQPACKRRALRAVNALVLLYFLSLIAMIIWGGGANITLVRNGFFTSIGIAALLVLHIIDNIAARRK